MLRIVVLVLAAALGMGGLSAATLQTACNNKAVINKCQKTSAQVQSAPKPLTAITRSEPQSIQKTPNQSFGDSDAKLDIDRKLADYTGQVAKYTSNLSEYTKWLVVVTALLVGIGVFQGYHLKRSVDASEDGLAAIQRAFVFVEMIEQNAGIDEHGKMIGWEIRVKWKNNGTTPTRHASMHLSRMTRADDLPQDFDFPDGWEVGAPHIPSSVLIGPKTELWGGPIVISTAELEAARRKLLRIFIWGWIDYNDIFPSTPRHRTEFCNELRVTGDPNDPLSINLIGFDVYRRHNGADEDCLKKPQPFRRPAA